MKFPTLAQWKQFFKILSKKELIFFAAMVLVFIASFSVLVDSFYMNNTVAAPDTKGTYTEGEIGAPRFLNPVYADSNDVDRDISELLFSGLMKYDENGRLVPDLAQDLKISDDGKTYEFFLKENAYWSDGQRLTADDVIYTIKTISDPAYKSPLRAKWLGVETEKISDTSLRLKLKSPYSSFLETCATKIIPQHIWQNISADNYPLSPFNLEPVGSGPFRMDKVNKAKDGTITSVDLVRNDRYYDKKPYIQKFVFDFFDDYENLATAFRRGVIKGFAESSAGNDRIAETFKRATVNAFSFPRYFALFFNSDAAPIFSDQSVRQAFNYATDKQQILAEVLNNEGKVVESPVLPELYGYSAPQTIYNFDLGKAQDLFDKAGYKAGADGFRVKVIDKKPAFQFNKNLQTGDSTSPDVEELQKCLQKEVDPQLEASGYYGAKTKDAVNKFQEKYRADILTPNNIDQPTGTVLKTTRDKLNAVCFPPGEESTPLKATISTVNQPLLAAVAEKIKAQWEKAGIKVDIKSYDISDLERDVIKSRDYETLLFGEVLGAIPDPYPFWNSTQKIDPGLNLSLYENADCDKLLKDARETLDENTRRQKLEAFQNQLIKDAPAVFLYNPDYFYLTNGEVKGIKAKIIVDPSKRFSGVENWYVKETRVWKQK